MPYVDENLIAGEQITYRARLHWKVMIGPILLSAVLIALAVVTFWLGSASNASGIWLIAGILLLVFAAIPIIQLMITVKSAEFAVTNKRVILKTGFIQKKTAEMFLAKVESVAVDQTMTGRVLGFGTIVIRGTGGSLEPFSDISRPLEFRRQIQEQIGLSLDVPPANLRSQRSTSN
jgi:uncharacterized membrane protein YdbT with pleckstrin-like domain